MQKRVMEFTDKKGRKRVKEEKNSENEKSGILTVQGGVGERTSSVRTNFVPSKKCKRRKIKVTFRQMRMASELNPR